MAVACFSKLSFSTQTAWLFAPENCCIGRFYGRCPNPQFLKKLSKLFCFWEDNLALAKFQCPTDTPPNHNLPQLLIKNRQNIRKKAVPNLRNCLFIKSSINVLGFCFFSFYRLWCRSYIFDCLFALFLFNNIDINANCHKACKAHR